MQLDDQTLCLLFQEPVRPQQEEYSLTILSDFSVEPAHLEQQVVLVPFHGGHSVGVLQ